MLSVIAFTLVNIYAMLLIAQGGNRFWGVTLGLERERDYFLAGRPSYPCPPYAACEAMNARLPEKAGVLFVGEARGCFYRGRLLAATVFDFPVLIDVCEESRNPADVNRKLKQLGMTHVFFNEAEASRIAGYRLFDWPDRRSREVFEQWWGRHLQLVWRAPWLEVFAVVPAGVRERTAALKYVFAPPVEYSELSALEGKALHALEQNRLEDAYSASRELVGKAPGIARSHEVLAQVLSFRNRDGEAYAEFRRAISLGLVSPQVHYNMSVILHRLGRKSEAEAEYRKFTELDAAAK
jgi:tetratricopeptide (TPR) repeat protein